ncbi:MAG: hypothetical protein ACKOXB_05350 [Flavobacteriales bacterium]
MGQYISNAVELVVYNKPSPLIDVNMARVLERFFGPRKMADIRYDPYLQELAYKVVNHKNAKEVNWAILDFAALVCRFQSAGKRICKDFSVLIGFGNNDTSGVKVEVGAEVGVPCEIMEI